MSINIKFTNTSAGIKRYSEQIESITNTAISLVKKHLPIDNIEIILGVDPTATINEMSGIGGFTPDAHTIFIFLDPEHKDFESLLSDNLLFILVHELHHTIRWQKVVEGDTLLEALVFEGLAEHFAMEVTGRKQQTPYSNALSSEQKEIFFNKAKNEWLLPSYNNPLWFFGSEPEVIPRWTGYTLGYDLVSFYLDKNPKESAATLVKADADIFLIK